MTADVLFFCHVRARADHTDRLLRMAFGEPEILSDNAAPLRRTKPTFEQRRLAAHRIAAQVRARKGMNPKRLTPFVPPTSPGANDRAGVRAGLVPDSLGAGAPPHSSQHLFRDKE